METRIDGLAEKLETLERSVKSFRDEFCFKMKLVERLLSTRNDELAVQSKCIQKEASLYKFLLSSWSDNILEDQSQSQPSHPQASHPDHSPEEPVHPEEPILRSQLAVQPVNETITLESIVDEEAADDDNDIHPHHPHHFPHCAPGHGHGHGHGHIPGHGHHVLGLMHGHGHGHGHSHVPGYGHGHHQDHIEFISLSEIHMQGDSTCQQNGELGEIVLEFHNLEDAADVNVENKKPNLFDPEEIETHGIEMETNSRLNEDLTVQPSTTSNRENENENSCSSITEIKVEDEKFDEELEVEIIQNDEIFSTAAASSTSASVSSFGYNCRVCGSSQATNDDLKLHMTRVHGGSGFICHYCGKNFSQLTSLNNHKRVHMEKKSLRCSICTNTDEFPSLEVLVEHMKIQHGIEKQVCELCEKEFAGPTYLKRHMCIFHNNDEFEKSAKRNKRCSMCPKSYQTRADLLVHVRSHTGEKPYSCHGCQKHFADTRNLKRHQERFPNCKIAHISFAGCHRNQNHPPECRFKSTK